MECWISLHLKWSILTVPSFNVMQQIDGIYTKSRVRLLRLYMMTKKQPATSVPADTHSSDTMKNRSEEDMSDFLPNLPSTDEVRNIM